MKKINKLLLCCIILLGICGCDNSKTSEKAIEPFIGTWEYVSSSYEEYEQYKNSEEYNLSMLNLYIDKDHLNIDFAFGDGVFFAYGNQMLKTMDSSNNYACFTLNNDELKQSTCSTEIVDYVAKMHSNIKTSKEFENYNIIYKKIS